jgi:PKD domain
MGVVTRKRPRRLVMVAAVIALAAALFVAIQAPLSAQTEPRITIKVDGENHYVTPEQLNQAADKNPPFSQESPRGNDVPFPLNQRGTSLDALLDAARPRVPGKTKLVELTNQAGSTVFAARNNSNIVFFWDEANKRFIWIEDGESTSRKQVTDEMVVRGRAGNLLTVDVDADPEKPRVGEEVTFTADADNELDGEELTYDWKFGDGDEDSNAGDSVTHTYDSRESFTVTVTVKGDKESRGVGEFTFRARKKAPPPKTSGGGGSSGGGSSGGGSSGGGSGGIPPSTGIPPAGSGPSTPALPPPSSSPPSDDPGRGPNLDPNAPPSADIETGQEVSGILVSTSTPPKPGQRAGSKAPNAQAKQNKDSGDEFDWKLAGGIALTALLVILGGLRERVRLQRLLPKPPKPQPQPQSG